MKAFPKWVLAVCLGLICLPSTVSAKPFFDRFFGESMKLGSSKTLKITPGLAKKIKESNQLERIGPVLPPEETPKSIHVVARSKERDGRRDLIHWVYDGTGAYRWHRIITPTSLPVENIDEPPVGVITQSGAHIFSRWGNQILYWKCGLDDLETAPSGDVACTVTALNQRDQSPVPSVQGCVAATSDARGNIHVIAKGNWRSESGNQDGYFIHWSGTDMNNFAARGPVRANDVYQIRYGRENYVRPESCPGVTYNETLQELQVFARGPWGDLTQWWLNEAGQEPAGQWGARQYTNYEERVPSGEGGQTNGRVVAVFNPYDQKTHVFFHDDSPALSGKFNGVVHAYGFGERNFDFLNPPTRYTSHIQMDTLRLDSAGDNQQAYASIDFYPSVVVTPEAMHVFGLNGWGIPHLVYHRLATSSLEHLGFSYVSNSIGGRRNSTMTWSVYTAPAAAVGYNDDINVFGRNSAFFDERGEGLIRMTSPGGLFWNMEISNPDIAGMPTEPFREIEGFPSVLATPPAADVLARNRDLNQPIQQNDKSYKQ